MSSRKRAKAKERKLKQQVKAQEPEERIVSHPVHHTDEIRPWEHHCQWSTCNHGCVFPPRGHPVHKFINMFDEQVSMENVLVNVSQTFDDHREAWKDNAMRKMAINLLLNIGTNFILRSNFEDAKKTTFAIVLLENYNGEDTIDSAFYPKGASHTGYMPGAGDKDVIRFYYKRIPCSCLKELYSEIKKSQDRFSTCLHCKQTVKRINLWRCGRCKCAYYCSKKCQISDWPSHKELCKEFCKGIKKAETTRRNEEGL